MKEVRQGVFKPNSPPIAVDVGRSYSYSKTMQAGKSALGLARKAGKTLNLFKVNGTALQDTSLTVNDKKLQWTLGNFLLKNKRSPAQTKLGIGYLCDSAFEDDDSEGKVNSIVTYSSQ